MGPSRETLAGSSPRILFVEDDELFAAVTAPALRRVAEVEWVDSAEHALAALERDDWDLLVADVDLPGMSGLALARECRSVRPFTAILILTGSRSLDTAVGALRAQADDFLTKPIAERGLTLKVEELIAASRAHRREARQVVLAIGAHPDDVEIGCGGILLRHVASGDEVGILTLTGGEAGGVVAERVAESRRAAELMSARLFHGGLTDTSLSVSDGGVMIGAIERAIADIGPQVIYTHSRHDVHQDHRNVHDATLVAARGVPKIYCYQAPSASIDFRPTRFVGIDEWLERKLEVIGAYGSQVEIRDYLQADLLRATARYWGRFARAGYVEPLEVIRDSDAVQGPLGTPSGVPDDLESKARVS